MRNRLIINGIDFDKRLDNAKALLHYNIDHQCFVDWKLKMFFKQGILIRNEEKVFIPPYPQA